MIPKPEDRLPRLDEQDRIPEPFQRVVDAERDKKKTKKATFNSAV